jgi:AraC-like DNA-binding protein
MEPQTIEKIIIAHLRRIRTVEHVATLCGLTSQELNKKVVRHYGWTTSQLIRHLRITRMRNLLREGKLKCMAVAFEVGFKSEVSAERRFLKEVGMTMQAYKKLHLTKCGKLSQTKNRL